MPLLLKDKRPSHTPDRNGALLLIETHSTRKHLSDLAEQAGYLATSWGATQAPPERPTLLSNRIAFVEVMPAWTGSVEILCRFKDLGFSGLVVLLAGEEAAAMERVQAVGAGLGLHMAAGLANGYRDQQVVDLLVVPVIAAVSATLVFDVREALAKNWLELWYQPQVDLKLCTLCGAEGLLRLRHPNHGLFPPSAFIPSVEADSYEAMTAFVVASAGRDWAMLGRVGAGLPISINSSLALVRNGALGAMIKEAWPDRVLRPSIIVEIPEDEGLGDIELVKVGAKRLSDQGARLSIDDFGNGLSGFARLRDMPCCEIKLDRGFVTGCSTDPRLTAICKATVSVAEQFRVRATAEGVETAEDLATVQRLGFDCAQGYFFAKPMPFPDFLLETRREN